MTDELSHGSHSLVLEAICQRDCSIHGNLLLKVLFMRRKGAGQGGKESAVKSPWPNWSNYSKHFTQLLSMPTAATTADHRAFYITFSVFYDRLISSKYHIIATMKNGHVFGLNCLICSYIICMWHITAETMRYSTTV